MIAVIKTRERACDSLNHLEPLIINDAFPLGFLLLHHHGQLLWGRVAVDPDLLLVHDHVHICELVWRVLNVHQGILGSLLLVEVDVELPLHFAFLGVHFVPEVHKEFLEVINGSALGDIDDVEGRLKDLVTRVVIVG